MTTSSNRPLKLLEQMQQELRTRGYAYRTERTYIDWIRKYIFPANRLSKDPRDWRLYSFYRITEGKRLLLTTKMRSRSTGH